MKGKIRETSNEQNAEIAHWFSYPAVLEEWHKTLRHGITLFFTGLSGAGKSTLAQVLYARLMEQEAHPVTFLDGDIMRKNISSELGFSHEHRDINIQRQAYIENLITRHGGIAICAPIAPYANTRAQVRVIVEEDGDFNEIYVATPLAVCESYDRKGLCARAGLIRQFTGVSDPYETPINPEIVVDTSRQSANEAADKILAYLAVQDFLSRHGKSPVALVKPERDPSLLWQNDSSGALPMTKSTPLIRYGQQVPKSRFSSNRKFFNRAVKWCEGGFIFLPARLSSLPAETAGRPRDDRPARGCRHARR